MTPNLEAYLLGFGHMVFMRKQGKIVKIPNPNIKERKEKPNIEQEIPGEPLGAFVDTVASAHKLIGLFNVLETEKFTVFYSIPELLNFLSNPAIIKIAEENKCSINQAIEIWAE